MKLFINGKEAVKGQMVTTFRGELGTLNDWREPYKASSTGRVYVTLNDNKEWGQNEWFPGVIKAEFKD